MPLIDLSLVTKTLTNVIEQVFTMLGYPQQTVSSLPPDLLKGQRALGLYLYHAEEHPTFKNSPPPGTDPSQPPSRFTSLGLNLYYQLTARSDVQETGSDI